jgi:hypothetical protein
MRGSGGMCGGTPRRWFCCRIISMKIKREGDGAMAVGGRHQTGGHNNQLKIGVSRERDIEEGTQLRRNVWGGGILQSFGGGKSGDKKYKNKNTSRP